VNQAFITLKMGPIHHSRHGICLACKTGYRHDWAFPDRVKDTLPCDCGRCIEQPFGPGPFATNNRLSFLWEQASKSFPVLVAEQTQVFVATSPTGERRELPITLPARLSYD
jgi:hypothetical protein